MAALCLARTTISLICTLNFKSGSTITPRSVTKFGVAKGNLIYFIYLFIISHFWVPLTQRPVAILSFPHSRHPSNSSSPTSFCTALANSLVSSKLDYCNLLYSGISQANLNKLQRIQNSLARIITNTSKYQHITPTLKKLHCLPVKQRIEYKLCLLTYKTQINNLHIFTIVFHFRHTLFLQDLLIHSFFLFHMSDHHLVKGHSLSLVHDFEIHYLLIPEIRILIIVLYCICMVEKINVEFEGPGPKLPPQLECAVVV